jgi:hypothetical protein
MGEKMNLKPANVVRLKDPADPIIRAADVVSLSPAGAQIRVDGVKQAARVAFSCLVRPEPGDRVLCTCDESGVFYILGIIDRPASRRMTLSFPADATLQAENGSLQMVSGRSLTLAAADSLSCVSETAVHKSREAVVNYDTVLANGDDLQANFNTVRLIGRVVNTMARQLIQRVKNYIRHSEDHDQVNAGQMTRKVDGLYAMDSRHTVMVSRKDTKIDGERIHMG